jgi:hypothetical protein
MMNFRRKMVRIQTQTFDVLEVRMKNPFKHASAVLLLSAVSFPCLAASSPWDGTWKLNEAKSQMAGEIYTLTALPNGGFHLSEGNGSFAYDYTCDGKDYVVTDRRTGTCIKVDEHHYKLTGKLDGKPSWHGTSTISDDGKFMTNEAVETRPDGVSSTVATKNERIGGSGTGRAGTWKSVKSSTSVPDVMKLTLNGNVLITETPAYKQVITAKLDGSPAHIEGADAPKALEMRMKGEGPMKIGVAITYNGKPAAEGYQTVSADGKVMTQVTWDTGKPETKETYVYEKQ